MSSVIDLEAQQVAQAAQRVQMEGVETLEKDISGILGSGHHTSVASPLRSVFTGQDIIDETDPIVSQAEGSGIGSGAAEKNIISDKQSQGEPHILVTSDTNIDPGRCNAAPDSESEEPRMIGDFDGSANGFWKLYRDEAKSHDDARISTLKDGMDSALIFAGLFSAILTAFVVDSKQNLKPSPADQTVYYLQQHSAILSQISIQLSSIAPQVPIPSTPPPPFPTSSPLASDIRINIFWFMALTFSLLAALLAILVQQWVRNYMHVFQRYGDPLKSSRLRQYLYEGCEKWNMPGVAEAVPGFLHVSLFLFFAGLGDSLLNINRKVALSTIVPIGVFVMLYIFTIFAPIIYPQSPYQNLFSGILWYLIQTLRGRRFRDHGDGEKKPVSGNMSLGQMQLAMEETVARKSRDVGATRWLIDNLTEDAEMEKFLSALPGSFNTDWGTEVWKRVGEHQETEDRSLDQLVVRPCMDTTTQQPSSSWSTRGVIRPIIHLVRKPRTPKPRHSPTHGTALTSDVHPHSTTAYIHGENVVYELSTRVARSVELCKNRGVFASDGLWRGRARACIEATASLVFCADAKITWFGDISKLLGDIGRVENIRELSSAGKDELFVMRWTCLSLMAIRPILADKENMHMPFWASATIDRLGTLDATGKNSSLGTVIKIDQMLANANDSLFELYFALAKPEASDGLTEEVKENLREHESAIKVLEQINNEADSLGWLTDYHISGIQTVFNNDSHQIISQLPGVIVVDEDCNCRAPIPFSRLVELLSDPYAVPFIRPRQTLQSMCSPALIFRNILEGQGDADAYKEVAINRPPFPRLRMDEMQRQFLRLRDLSDGGGLGFIVELFFLAFSRLISTSSSKESHSALYRGTFRAITSDWARHKNWLGTQRLLLDIAMSRREEFNYEYPAYITDEFLSLLGNVFEGQIGPHIDSAIQEFQTFEWYGEFGKRASIVLTRGQAQLPAAS